VYGGHEEETTGELVKRNLDISPHPAPLVDMCCFPTKKKNSSTKVALPKRRTVIIAPPGQMPKFGLVH
jgi:hypothetical protein